MSQTVFSRVEVDGTTPAMGEDNSQDMDVPGGPSSFRPLTRWELSGRPMRTVSPGSTSPTRCLQLHEYQFAYPLQHGGPSDDSQIVAESGQLLRALDTSEEDLAAQTWPADVSSDIQSLLSDDYLLSEDLRFIADGDYSSSRLERVLHDQDIAEKFSEGYPGRARSSTALT